MLDRVNKADEAGADPDGRHGPMLPAEAAGGIGDTRIGGDIYVGLRRGRRSRLQRVALV